MRIELNSNAKATFYQEKKLKHKIKNVKKVKYYLLHFQYFN